MADRLAVDAWESLFRAQVAVMRQLAAEFPSRQISLNEYDVLFTLSQQPDRQLRLRDLNRLVLLSQPSVSRLVDRLILRGYLAKCDDPTDGRGAVIRLTDAGFELFRRVAVDHIKSIDNHVGSVLDADELAALMRICDKLRAAQYRPPRVEPAEIRRPSRHPRSVRRSEHRENPNSAGGISSPPEGSA